VNQVVRIKEVALIVAISGALYTVVDVAFGVLSPTKPYESHVERLNSSAYINESYFSEGFLVESFTQPGFWHTPRGTKLVLPGEFHGRYFNVDVLEPTHLPYRRTNNGSPLQDSNLVLILGGSTIYNSEVPDEFTVATQLAKLLNATSKDKFFVLNAGVTSVNTTQELERLQFELQQGLHPKIVVSFSGVNDVYQGVYFGNPNGVMFSEAQRSKVKELVKHVIPLNIYNRLRLKADRENGRTFPQHLLDGQILAKKAESVGRIYFENMSAMEELARGKDFVFFAFLQPYLLSSTFQETQKDVEEVLAVSEKAFPHIELAFSFGYQALRKTVGALQDEGISSYDLSEIFAGKTRSIFLDWAHVNSVGNKVIAEAIATIILSSENQKGRLLSETNGIKTLLGQFSKRERGVRAES